MMYAEESYVNETEGYRIGDSDPYETWTDDVGKLFRGYQREYGRCTGYCYIDTPNGSEKIGWVFEKKMKYSDCNQYYMQTTWVILMEQLPEVKVTKFYYYL